MALPKPRQTHNHIDDGDEVLIARHVETAPAYPTPERARLVETGVSVTAVITQLTAAGRDSAYYERHKAVIDAKITLNMAGANGEGRT